jgi:hypothetical protein
MKIKAVYLALALVLLFSLVATIAPSGTAKAATLCVNPGGTGGCYDSIQAAVTAANPTGGDTIIVAAGQYNEHIIIDRSLTIQGAGAGSTIVDGSNNGRIFHINGNYTVEISALMVQNGNSSPQDGGGIFNQGMLTITDCTISGNYAGNRGGGIYNVGDTLTMTGCTISGNEADDGGGIYNAVGEVTLTNCTVSDNTARAGNGGGISTVIQDATLTMTNCTISGNKASNDGGGIYNYLDEVTLTNCTISGNEAGDNGGGIRNYNGRVDMTNCTVSGNNAHNGGGIYTYVGLTTLTNCTVSNNYAQNWGGGVYNEGTGLPDYVELRCTIIYGNADADIDTCYDNYYGEYIDIGDESIVDECLGSTLNPLLGPLQNNGGTTETHALLAGSPAIDACVTSCTVNTDQRGLPRPVDGDSDRVVYCDVGAYEKQPPVGGIVEQVDRLELLSPWLALAALMVVALSVVVLMRRRHLT